MSSMQQSIWVCCLNVGMPRHGRKEVHGVMKAKVLRNNGRKVAYKAVSR